jgi:hypothetical protein
LCGKAIKPLFFKAPFAASGQHIFTLILLLRDCAVIRRVAVFLYRKGRRGFAEDARASRPLRKVVGGCGSRPAAGTLRKGREALAPFALQKHRNAVKKHANFFHTIPVRTKHLAII